MLEGLSMALQIRIVAQFFWRNNALALVMAQHSMKGLSLSHFWRHPQTNWNPNRSIFDKSNLHDLPHL